MAAYVALGKVPLPKLQLLHLSNGKNNVSQNNCEDKRIYNL